MESPAIVCHESSLAGLAKAYGTADDGQLFRAARGGRVRSTEYCELWDEARGQALTKARRHRRSPTPLLAQACRRLPVGQLRRGPGRSRPRAGHSHTVLFRFYAKILRGQQTLANDLIDKGLSGSD